MTGWTQHHPTQALKTPDGREVDIDLEMVALVRQARPSGKAERGPPKPSVPRRPPG